MPLLTSFPTETFVKRETRWGASEGAWIRQFRNVSVVTERFVFSTLAEAEEYLESIVGDNNIDTDGIARVINDVGWAEVITSTTTEEDWQTYGE